MGKINIAFAVHIFFGGCILLSVIEFVYGKFVLLLSGWKLAYFAIFLIAFPLIALALQVVVFAKRHCYAMGRRRLASFLKRNSFITPRNLFFFNKKVVKVFPQKMRKQVGRIVDSGLDPEELTAVFKYNDCCRKPNIVKIGYFVHIVSMGVIMSLNGFVLAQIAFAVVGMSIVWIAVGVVDMLVSSLVGFVDRRNKKKFVFALERNLMAESPEIDLTVPQKSGTKSDSVSTLAEAVEDFLAANPDKGIAGVVLKSLYSASFSGAMSDESAKRLKNVMLDLKKYVG